jgi:hypothetical protein
MKAEDIYGVIGVYKMTTGWAMNLRDVKYDNLLVNGAAYYIAFAYDNYSLWGVSGVGYTNSNSIDCGIRPIVSLCPTVRTSNKDMIGAWNIEI